MKLAGCHPTYLDVGQMKITITGDVEGQTIKNELLVLVSNKNKNRKEVVT